VLVEGPAGIGKTRLLAAAGDLARAQGLAVLEARGNELEREAPFGVAAELLGPAVAGASEEARKRLLGGRAALASSLLDSSESGPGDAQALVWGLYWVTVALASEPGGGPLAIVLDDAQSADRPSLAFLAYLAARIEELPVALVMARRSGEPAVAAEVLASLRELPRCTILEPAALSEGAVARIVTDELPGAEPAFASACAKVSGGNPFLSRELARALRADRIPPTTGSIDRVERLVPSSVLHSMLVRMGRYGDGARRVAAAVAVLGDGTPLRRAAALAELDADEAERAADALAEAEILIGGEPLGFTHPLIATTVYSDQALFARARSHRRAAELLEAEGAPVQEVAAHLLLARPEGDRATMETLRKAGRRALANGDPVAATHLLQRALAEPPAADQRADLLLELAGAESSCMDDAAEGHVVEALELLEGDPAPGAALRVAAGVWLALGDVDAAADAMRRALRNVDREDPASEKVLADYLTVNMFRAPLHPDVQARMEPIVQAARGGAPPTEPGLLAHLALRFALAGEGAELVRVPAERATATDPLVDASSYGMLMGIVVQALGCVDELQAAERIAAAGLKAARRQGSALAAAVASYHHAIPLFHRGALADVLADLDQARSGFDEGWDGGRAWVAALRAQTHLELGDIAAARDALEIAPISPDSMDHGIVLFARAKLALAERDPATALRHAVAAGHHLRAGFAIDHPGLVAWRDTAAQAALALGEREEAARLSEQSLERARWCRVPRTIALAHRTAAALAGGQAGIDLLSSAAELLADSPSTLVRAHVLVELGGALRRDGRRSDARTPLREALQMADRMGAAPVAEAAREELRATGARPRRAAHTGVDALTPAERRVAQLAAERLTNPQIAQDLFVTTKTIQTHLAHAYRKLGIASRRELPSALGGGSESGAGDG
jgi:DNA-binding CsgD family transcriptional regulator